MWSGWYAWSAERYVDADVAARMQAALEARLAHGAYDALRDGPQLSEALTKDLQEISRDAHLAVLYHADAQPTDPERAEQQQREEMRRVGPLINFGLDRVERLDGNVGLLALRGFFPAHVPGAGEAIAAAMTVIAHTEALIVDLRRNGGGEPAMVALVCGYFFAEPLLSVSFVSRSGETESQNWTPAHVAGPRYLDRPVYALTSAMTASGAEECIYTLKTRGVPRSSASRRWAPPTPPPPSARRAPRAAAARMPAREPGHRRQLGAAWHRPRHPLRARSDLRAAAAWARAARQ